MDVTVELSSENADRESVINLDEDEDAVAQTLLLTLKSEGTLRPGDSEADPDIKPPWLDKAKHERGREILRTHLFGFFYNHLCGLVLLVYCQSILKPLLFTRNSRSVANIFRRYLSTLNHVKLWYDGDIWNKEDPARQSILTVRRMHKKVGDQLNLEKVRGAQELSVSQYDMLITQFAFLGFVVLKPKKFGLVLSTEDLECVMHFWRSVAYLLGTEEKFNLFSRSTDEVRALCAAILEYEMRTSLHGDVEESREMSRGILESIRPYIPLIRWECFFKYLLELAGENSTQVVLGTASAIIYSLMCFTLQYMLRVYFVAVLLDFLLRRTLRSAQQKKNKIAKDLSERYTLCLGESIGNPIRSTLYEGSCPVRSV